MSPVHFQGVSCLSCSFPQRGRIQVKGQWLWRYSESPVEWMCPFDLLISLFIPYRKIPARQPGKMPDAELSSCC